MTAVGTPAFRSGLRAVFFDFAGTPTELVDTFRQYYGPTMNAFAAAEQATGLALPTIKRCIPLCPI